MLGRRWWDLYVAATITSFESLKWCGVFSLQIIVSLHFTQVEKLCIHYGPLIGHVDSQPFYDLPPASALTSPEVESHLRQLGFGYRAKYLHQTAVMIAEERAPNWLNTLRNPESPVLGMKPGPAGKMNAGGRAGYREAHEQLLQLQGVGPKVADCVCLMGLGWGEAVPVDTHGEYI